MLVSVIICTYGRATPLGNLLASLDAQTYRNVEILVIDGNENPSLARKTVEVFLEGSGARTPVRLFPSEKGLTCQRNVGLKHARGSLVCFLDDDVRLESAFMARAVQLFELPEWRDVGGITGYDSRNYPTRPTSRWHLRRAFGVFPNLQPGGVDHLGRAVPLSFLEPFSGCKEVGWLPGFCMVYRSAAVKDLCFDELVPTYGGEDRDFSMQVGEYWRLLICGDLRVEHCQSLQSRDSELQRVCQSSFGAGRRFARRARNIRDYLTVVRTVLGDFMVDVILYLHRPERTNLLTLFVRIRGFFAGLRSSRDRYHDMNSIRQKPEQVSGLQ